MKPCCQKLAAMLHDPEAGFLYFDIYDRLEFLFITPGYVNEPVTLKSSVGTLHFCPWCDNPFLVNFWLQETLFKLIAKEFPHIKPEEQYDLFSVLPEEFQSDAWWKKRQIKLKYGERPAKTKDFSAIFTANKGCCFQMTDVMFSSKYTCPQRLCTIKPIIYKAAQRNFYFSSNSSFILHHRFFVSEKTVARTLLSPIFYCPWCGINLPTSLAAEWFRIVTTEFGVTDIYNKAQLKKKLPAEFLTEEWWRKRGL